MAKDNKVSNLEGENKPEKPRKVKAIKKDKAVVEGANPKRVNPKRAAVKQAEIRKEVFEKSSQLIGEENVESQQEQSNPKAAGKNDIL